MLISSKEILITQIRRRIAESRDQFTSITTAMVVVPVAAVNCSRPYSHGALILQAIVPLCELGSDHLRLHIQMTSVAPQNTDGPAGLRIRSM